MQIGLDVKALDRVLDQYPTMEILLLGGVVSKKQCRELLDIPKGEMDEMYNDLLLAQAVTGVSSSCFRATKDTMSRIRERRKG